MFLLNPKYLAVFFSTPEEIRWLGSEKFIKPIFLQGYSIENGRGGNLVAQDQENNHPTEFQNNHFCHADVMMFSRSEEELLTINLSLGHNS